MNILFLVHIEDAMRPCMSPRYPERVAEVVFAAEYDRVYAMTSGFEHDPYIWEIGGVVTAEIEWAWGYEPEAFEDQPKELPWLIESAGHEYTWVPPELRNLARLLRLPDVSVTVGGGVDGECLTDFCCVLDHLEVEYQVDRAIVY